MATDPLYKIINPSDPYSLRSPSRLDAALAVLLLGDGYYPLEEDGSEWRVPCFFGGLRQVEFWLDKEFQESSLDGALTKRALQIACVLDTVLIGSMSERFAVEEALLLISDEESKRSYRERFHDQRRTSMNDIGARAAAFAEGLRARYAETSQAGA